MHKKHKGWLIVSKIDKETGMEFFYCYTPDELEYPAALRSYEWEACSLQEALDFINSCR
jgi:hypothetical protein